MREKIVKICHNILWQSSRFCCWSWHRQENRLRSDQATMDLQNMYTQIYLCSHQILVVEESFLTRRQPWINASFQGALMKAILVTVFDLVKPVENNFSSKNITGNLPKSRILKATLEGLLFNASDLITFQFLLGDNNTINSLGYSTPMSAKKGKLKYHAFLSLYNVEQWLAIDKHVIFCPGDHCFINKNFKPTFVHPLQYHQWEFSFPSVPQFLKENTVPWVLYFKILTGI